MHYLFHLATGKDYRTQAQSETIYEPAAMQSEGFIHCSLAHQLPDVILKHFPNHKDMVCLVIDPLRVAAPVRYEDLNNEGEKFPHIYGPINWDSILEVIELKSTREIPPRLKQVLAWNHSRGF